MQIKEIKNTNVKSLCKYFYDIDKFKFYVSLNVYILQKPTGPREFNIKLTCLFQLNTFILSFLFTPVSHHHVMSHLFAFITSFHLTHHLSLYNIDVACVIYMLSFVIYLYLCSVRMFVLVSS